MDFSSEISVAIGATVLSIIVLGGFVWLRQRNRERRRFHWLGIFVIAGLIGMMTGIGLHLSAGSSSIHSPAPMVELSQATVSAKARQLD